MKCFIAILFFSFVVIASGGEAWNLKLTVVEAGVSPKKVDHCLLWAFGAGWQTAPVSSATERWNKLHSNIFVIHGTDEWECTMKFIARAYLAKHKWAAR
jgi:hypothetical protein